MSCTAVGDFVAYRTGCTSLAPVDLSDYKGQAVVIKFMGTKNTTKQTSFVLDDVTLTVQ